MVDILTKGKLDSLISAKLMHNYHLPDLPVM